MANNLFADVPAAVVAKSTVSFVAAGFNAGNCRIIYEVGNPLKSWVPDRDINAITGFTAEKGYYIVPAATMDMEAILIPPIPAGGGGSTPAAPTSGVVDDTADTFNWTNNPLYPDLSDYEFTLNGGTSYAVVTAKPIVVGAVSKAIGQVGVRVKAVGGDTASSTLYNGTAFTSGADTDALAYFAAVEATGATISSPHKTAISDFYVGLKGLGKFTNMKALYFYMGATAAAQAINGKTPGTFNITWNGGVTHSANGFQGDGSTGYGDTGINDNTDLQLNSLSFGGYSRTNADGSGFMMGVYEPGQFSAFIFDRFTIGAVIHKAASDDVPGQTPTRLISVARQSVAPAFAIYRDGVTLTADGTAGSGKTNGNIYLGAIFNVNTPGPAGFSNKEYAFNYVYNGDMSPTDHSNFNNLVNTLMTALGRNV